MLFTFSAQAYAADPRLPAPVLASTGIDDLDHLLGGLRDGAVWVVTGPARSGRTALAIQLAAGLARSGSPVRFFLGRDPIQEIAARLTAHTERRRLTETRRTGPTGDEPWTRWAWDFVPQPKLQRTDDWEVLPTGGPCCLVIDDLDLWRGDPVDFLEIARSHARGRACAVILTLPEHCLRPQEPAAWQAWARGADVILALRPGEDAARIEIVTHRTGPCGTIEVYDHFERARFETPMRMERTRPPSRPIIVEQGDVMADHDWDSPDSQRLAESCSRALAILRHPDTPAKVAAFYDPVRNYAGATFNDLAPNDPFRLDSSDLLAVTLMNVAVQPAALRRLLEPGDDHDAVLATLATVPVGTSLADADPATLDAAAAFYQAVKVALRGDKWVTASKIGSRKRPSLIPVRDRVVVEELNLPRKDFREAWTLMRGMLNDTEVRAALAELKQATASSSPTVMELPELRLLDTAIWMRRRLADRPGASEGGDE